MKQLLDFADKYLGLFSRTARKDRHVRHGFSEQVAAASVANAFELKRGGLKGLRQVFDDAHKVYEKKAEQIRHQVYAHTAADRTQEQRGKLFEDLPLCELEQMAVVPYLIHHTLSQLYLNGRQPVMPTVPYAIADVIATVPQANTTTWQHQLAASDTRRFLEWLLEMSRRPASQ